jgi:hypothetical protein
MLNEPLRIATLSITAFCLFSQFAVADGLPTSKIPSIARVDESRLVKVSFWGLPYPYGYAWEPCFGWRSVLTRHGHRRWYRVRLPSEDCRL